MVVVVVVMESKTNKQTKDPRTGATSSSCEAHDGTKTTKLEWLGSLDKFVTVSGKEESWSKGEGTSLV